MLQGDKTGLTVQQWQPAGLGVVIEKDNEQ